ncbi:MAG: hypothetical protein ACLTDV_03430 [Eubacterium sp.]
MDEYHAVTRGRKRLRRDGIAVNEDILGRGRFLINHKATTRFRMKRLEKISAAHFADQGGITKIVAIESSGHSAPALTCLRLRCGIPDGHSQKAAQPES